MKNVIVLLCIVIAYGLVGCKQKSNQTAAKVSDQYDGQQTEDFQTFYTKFLKDGAFQLSRIQFPLDGDISEDGRMISDKIEKEDWELLIGSIYDVDTTEYRVEIKEDPKDVFHRIYIPDSGIDIVSKYQNINNKWYLVYYKSIFN